MKSIDVEFLNEYLPVEKICNEIYDESGVTAYINDMQCRTANEKWLVHNWDVELKKLKHLRWLRNQIVHPNNSYEVTQQDLIDIKTFHNKLLTQQDPLALLYKEIEKDKKKQQKLKLQQKVQQQLIEQKLSDYPDEIKPNSIKWIIAASIALASVAAVIAVIVFFFT
ncbi:MAG: hypothetical protein E7570_09525 [Ruminococcaceae bacterium]|nr:hypothetical protein [Oscillospiraceae bacterium]